MAKVSEYELLSEVYADLAVAHGKLYDFYILSDKAADDTTISMMLIDLDTAITCLEELLGKD